LNNDNAYYAGSSTFSFALPENIILFNRTNSGQLVGPTSYHHRYVMMLNYGGEMSVVVDNFIFVCSPGRAMLIFPNQFHHYIVNANKDIAWLFITFELHDEDLLKPLRNMPVPFAPANNYINLLVDLYATPSSGGKPLDNEVTLLTSLVLHQLVSSAPSVVEGGQNAGAGQSGDNFIHQINNWIYSNLDQNFTIKDIAEKFSLSESHLRSVYRKKVGLSLGVYIKHMKVRKSLWLMKTSDVKLSEIAAACGYGSLVAFTYAFRRAIGESPGEYRRKYLSKRE
jgi:AraC-like DNA-binding protein